MGTFETNGKTKSQQRNRRYREETAEILKLKNDITEIKYSLDELNIRMEMLEERLSELQDRSIEIIQVEQQREKKIEKKKEQNFRDL